MPSSWRAPLRIAVLSTGRQDWGILRSTCRLLRDDARFELRLLAGGMHSSPRFGLTIRDIEEDGFSPAEVLCWTGGNRAASPHAQAGAALTAVGDALLRERPDALMLVGDRFETAAAAVAATLARMPIVHLHGGETTQGSFDDAFRHAITRLAHLHLVSRREYGERVVAMGEDPRTVHVVGAPGLDNLHRPDLAGRDELESFLGLRLEPPVVQVTLHPATYGGDPIAEASAIAKAMDEVEATYVITLPNADPGEGEIRDILGGAARGPRRAATAALGERRFWGLMRLASAMLGNSSSAIIEAPALRLPAVNVGIRQQGRIRGASVIDVPAEAAAIAEGLRLVLTPGFRQALSGADSPYGDGRAAERIVTLLAGWTPPSPPFKASWPGATA